MATLTKARKAELKASALEALSDLNIERGETIYTDTQYVGRNGTAYVRAWVVRDNKLIPITWHIGHATHLGLSEREGRWVIRTGGWGYSRSQHVVDALSWVLFSDHGQLKDLDI